MKNKTLVIDLDGTICSQVNPTNYYAYSNATPNLDVIKRVNEFWTKGGDVIIHTARGMNSCNGDLSMIEENYRKMTENWLRDNRVCYTKLIFGKPAGDYYVDDKGMNPDEFITRDFEL